MKRIVLVLFIYSISVFAYCQKPRQAYCEITVWPVHLMFNVAVTFDFGMQTYTTAMLYDSRNQPLKFVSGMDAVNYLSKRGWKLASTYFKTISGKESVHYVMEKNITKEEQVVEGLVMKQIKLDEFIKKLQQPNFSPEP